MVSDSWPPGGRDDLLEALQERYLPALDRLDLPGLLGDARLGRAAIVSSFGADSVVLLHYLAGLGLKLPVIFLETGKHFPETLDYVARIGSELGLDLRRALPDPRLIGAEDPAGDLWRDDPDMCCRLRKTLTLQDALDPFDSWISGRKRFQAGTRAALPILERDGAKIKVNPLALWSAGDIAAYMRRHGLPQHPLVARGFPSIGCAPCTRAVRPGEDLRAGRWAHMPDKTECGIHLGPDGRIRRRGGSGGGSGGRG